MEGSLVVDATLGPLTLTARAWDTNGAAQPESAASLWNPNGYANTSWATYFVVITQLDSLLGDHYACWRVCASTRRGEVWFDIRGNDMSSTAGNPGNEAR